jgi:urease accessory protein
VNVNLDVMTDDAGRMRKGKPFGFTDLSRGRGLDAVVGFILEQGGLEPARKVAAEA